VPARTALALAAFAITAVPAAAQGPQRTAKLLHPMTVLDSPAGHREGTLAATRPLTGSPTVVPVIAAATAHRRSWLRVRLPQRPNGATGWISADGTLIGAVRWRVVVHRARRRAIVYRYSRPVRSFQVVVGKRSTPTPAGRFFVTERVRQPPRSPLGPWVLATSAYSNVLQDFDGGPGQIGLHGRTGLAAPLGTAASHGCVRFSDRAIAWLAPRARPGTPIVIRH
jgi:lipoprotein-anchoring transpeptidase ErfK/SrfK